MIKYRLIALLVLIVGGFVGYFVYSSEMTQDSNFKFKYGLDLNGGTGLVYRANVENLDPSEISNAMDTLRRTIEKRINIFGVSEPIVQTEIGSSFSDEKDKHRLIVELPGVTNSQEAIDSIGETPLLEFRLLKEDVDTNSIATKLASLTNEKEISAYLASMYQSPVLTGGSLDKASLVFDPTSGQPLVTLDFNAEGSKVFEQITETNIGKELAIFLDGEIISNPIIQAKISGGTAQINGDFTPVEARDLVNNLNFGALPVPIELMNTQTVDATLGYQTLLISIKAMFVSFLIISLFMILFYRLPGIISVISLGMYILIMLALFKVIPVVLTAAGIAGFILSLGIAVDANVLIFERIREELQRGNELREAITHGFSRAWTSIRDGNITSIIAAVILYWFSDVSLIRGFALVFGLGVIMSMVSAVLISKTLLLAISTEKLGTFGKFLYSKGLNFTTDSKSITSNAK